jgi:hypothetical protein
VKIERELRKKGYRYLRKQGDVSDTTSGQTIDSLRLGQIALAYFLNLPEKAKTSDSIFGDLYDKVFDADVITANSVLAVHNLYRLIEDKKLLAKAVQRKISKDEYAEEWIIEGIFSRTLCH